MNLPSYTWCDYCPAVHAEENALLNAARYGSSVLGGILYLCGQTPEGNIVEEGKTCDRCKRALINEGIKQVITIKNLIKPLLDIMSLIGQKKMQIIIWER